MDMKKILAYVRKQNELHPILATRGLKLQTIEPGQLHCPLDSEDFSEVFYLILRKCGGYYLVIPGSLHARMAGDQDIILPKNVMGDFISLSLDLAKVLPASSIGNGFAKLDEATFANVEVAYDNYKIGKSGPYPFALPYGSVNDPMAQYHENIRDLVNQACDLTQTIRNHFAESPILFKKALLFPTPMAIARDIGILKKRSLPSFMMPQQDKSSNESKKTARCRIQGYDDAIFNVMYYYEEGILQLTCRKTNGDTVSCFDSWLLADESGTIFSEIKAGKAEIHALKQWKGALCLIDGKQCIHTLMPE